jgi:hypothetical protein
LADLHNGDILLAQDQLILILHNETLEVKQIIPFGPQYYLTKRIFTYFDPKTNKSKYLIGAGMETFIFSELIRDEVTGKYRTEYRFNTPSSYPYTFNFDLTSPESGVLHKGVYFEYWNNFHSIIDLSFDLKDFLNLKQKVAVSFD